MATIDERINKDGSKSYRVRIRRVGHLLETKTFKRKTDAKNYINKVEADLHSGKYRATPEARKNTLSDAIDRYIQTILPRKPKSVRDQTYQLGCWKKELGHLKLAQITPAHVAQLRDKFSEEETVRGSC